MSRKLIASLTLRIVNHAKQQASSKGFSIDKVQQTFTKPDRVIPSRTYPGQIRVCGLCLVGRLDGRDFVLITVYADRIFTPPRLDQLGTEKGRQYAEWYSNSIAQKNKHLDTPLDKPLAQKKRLEVFINGVKRNS